MPLYSSDWQALGAQKFPKALQQRSCDCSRDGQPASLALTLLLELVKQQAAGALGCAGVEFVPGAAQRSRVRRLAGGPSTAVMSQAQR